MKHDIYLESKKLLKSQAKELKRTNSDKGYIRYELNSALDSAIKQINWYAMKGRISEKLAALYSKWLDLFTCSLHP